MKNKKIIIIAGIATLLVLSIIGTILFFNRKFEVTFEYGKNIKSNTIKVKYGKLIDKKYIRDGKELGKDFMYWYEVTTDKNGNKFEAKEKFDFNTKIKKDTYLKAKYDDVKRITVKFETDGGNEIPDIILEEGETLTLPENPTKENYTFIGWKDKNETPIYNEALLADDITLYAIWERNEEVIGLTISNKVIHPNGKNKTIESMVNLQNTTDTVTYTLSDTKCVNVDENGKVTFNKTIPNECTDKGRIVKLIATLPSGYREEQSFEIEKDLILTIGDNSLKSDNSILISDEFDVKSNISVDWKVVTIPGNAKYTGQKTKTSNNFIGNYSCTATGNICLGIQLIATTPAGQEIKAEILSESGN